MSGGRRKKAGTSSCESICVLQLLHDKRAIVNSPLQNGQRVINFLFPGFFIEQPNHLLEILNVSIDFLNIWSRPEKERLTAAPTPRASARDGYPTGNRAGNPCWINCNERIRLFGEQNAINWLLNKYREKQHCSRRREESPL
jgi:hypothetical protein